MESKGSFLVFKAPGRCWCVGVRCKSGQMNEHRHTGINMSGGGVVLLYVRAVPVHRVSVG